MWVDLTALPAAVAETPAAAGPFEVAEAVAGCVPRAVAVETVCGAEREVLVQNSHSPFQKSMRGAGTTTSRGAVTLNSCLQVDDSQEQAREVRDVVRGTRSAGALVDRMPHPHGCAFHTSHEARTSAVWSRQRVCTAVLFLPFKYVQKCSKTSVQNWSR